MENSIKIFECRLKDIDVQLKEMFKRSPDRIVYGPMGEIFKLPSFNNPPFNIDLYKMLCNNKLEIVQQLYKLKAISEEEYKKFWLAESPHFTPVISNYDGKD